MSLTSTFAGPQQYTANGTTTAFATVFYFLENSDVSVQQTIGQVTTVLNQGSDYTMSGALNPSGGTVTCAVAPPSGAIITIIRTTPNTQEITFVDNDALPAASLETGLDKLTMEIQELRTGGAPLTRAVQFPVTEPATTNTILPTQEGRIGKVFGFDNNGNIYLFTDIGTFRGNWVTGTAYNFRDIFTDPITQNVYFVTTGYTSADSVATDVANSNAVLVIKSEINTTIYTPNGTTQTIDFSLGDYFVLNLGSATGTVVLTFINVGPGTNAIIEMVQGSTPRNCTFPAGTIQYGGGGVTYTPSGANGIDLVAIGFKDAASARIAITKGYS